MKKSKDFEPIVSTKEEIRQIVYELEAAHGRMMHLRNLAHRVWRTYAQEVLNVNPENYSLSGYTDEHCIFNRREHLRSGPLTLQLPFEELIK